MAVYKAVPECGRAQGHQDEGNHNDRGALRQDNMHGKHRRCQLYNDADKSRNQLNKTLGDNPAAGDDPSRPFPGMHFGNPFVFCFLINLFT